MMFYKFAKVLITLRVVTHFYLQKPSGPYLVWESWNGVKRDDGKDDFERCLISGQFVSFCHVNVCKTAVVIMHDFLMCKQIICPMHLYLNVVPSTLLTIWGKCGFNSLLLYLFFPFWGVYFCFKGQYSSRIQNIVVLCSMVEPCIIVGQEYLLFQCRLPIQGVGKPLYKYWGVLPIE